MFNKQPPFQNNMVREKVRKAVPVFLDDDECFLKFNKIRSTRYLLDRLFWSFQLYYMMIELSSFCTYIHSSHYNVLQQYLLTLLQS